MMMSNLPVTLQHQDFQARHGDMLAAARVAEPLTKAQIAAQREKRLDVLSIESFRKSLMEHAHKLNEWLAEQELMYGAGGGLLGNHVKPERCVIVKSGPPDWRRMAEAMIAPSPVADAAKARDNRISDPEITRVAIDRFKACAEAESDEYFAAAISLREITEYRPDEADAMKWDHVILQVMPSVYRDMYYPCSASPTPPPSSPD